ncbi:hypothetical protein VSX64_21095 [Aurantimonas sp. C2-6-R+9]|uniref:hypothetical protein n=2 Tax=Aurantimonas TaxID=182269 RepID=UPI002E171949|nr:MULTISPECIES: hypothetical protein [unclassified Aurantimonas]MEC5293387.1 hypothetical protein [Aurantimonas sp. C2-3-R2]MEC5383303.1 hypothetical protein [Aurantimonas sp. C2-6-R+9]MEC5414469.1 hypothetical protein [Aurantimonas sp. C2-4-R8]
MTKSVNAIGGPSCARSSDRPATGIDRIPQHDTLSPDMADPEKQTTEQLEEAIAAAEREKAIWTKARMAYRQEGEVALNPYSPRDPEHKIWAEGFAHEKSKPIKQWGR